MFRFYPRNFALIWLSTASIWCLLTSTTTVLARDWHVDNVLGDDRWDGAAGHGEYEKEGPFRTIRRALQHTLPGDRVVLKKNDEPYRESITLAGTRHSGSVLTPLIIEGNGAVLDGSTAIEDDAWQAVGGEFFRLPLEQSAYQQLFLDGLPATRVTTRTTAEVPVKSWRLETGALLFRVEPTRLPDHYKPSIAKHPVGITIYKTQRVIIRDLTVQGFQIDGIQVHDTGFSQPIVLAGVTARGNGRSGVAVVGAAGAALDGCLIGNNGAAQLIVSGPAEAQVTNSNVLDNTAPAYEVQQKSRLLVDGKVWEDRAK